MGAILFIREKGAAVAASMLAKAHIKGYTKGDGTYVAPHETKAASAKGKGIAQFDHKAPLPAEAYAGKEPPAAAPAKAAPTSKQMALFSRQKPGTVIGAQYGGKAAPKATPKWKNDLVDGGANATPHYPDAQLHPQDGDKGEAITINKPSTPSSPESWADPQAIATFVPDGDVPAELNRVAFEPWEDAPTTAEGWATVPGQLADLDEPLMNAAKGLDGKFKDRAAGVIIEEPDGRVWLMRPTNRFGGYDATFPKGRMEKGLSMQACAIKECFEETGLQVAITGYWGDIERTQTVARYYRARRVGGSPAHMGWEAQAVQLVPKSELPKVLNTTVDHKILSLGSENQMQTSENNMKKD